MNLHFYHQYGPAAPSDPLVANPIALSPYQQGTNYCLILGNQSKLVCRFRPDFSITFANETFGHYLGTRDSLVGCSFLALFSSEEDQQALNGSVSTCCGEHLPLAHFFKAFTPETPTHVIEQQMVGTSGHRSWQRWTIFAIFDTQRHLIEYHAEGMDMTPNRMREEPLDLDHQEQTRHLLVMIEELQKEVAEYESHHRALHQREAVQRNTCTYLETTNLELRQRLALLQAIFDTIQDGLLLVDSEFRILATNQTIATLLGCQHPDLINQPVPEVLLPPSHENLPIPPSPQFPNGNTPQDPQGRPLRWRKRVVRHDGKARILDMHVLPVGNAPVSALAPALAHIPLPNTCTLLQAVDVTESLKRDALAMEHERRQANRALTEMIAHEVNSPLQAIVSIMGLMQDASQEEHTSYQQIVRQEIARITNVLGQIKNVYRETPDPCDLVEVNPLIERVLVLTTSRLSKHRICLEQALQEALPRVYGRADELTQVLLNLVSNAIEAMPNGGTLRICTGTLVSNGATSTLGSSIKIAVSDTGETLPPDQQPHIFEPFATDGNGRRCAGLFVSHEIIQQHGGTITVDSQPDTGTTFTIHLPFQAEGAS